MDRSLTIAKDGNVLYTRAIGYSQINGTEKKPFLIMSLKESAPGSRIGDGSERLRLAALVDQAVAQEDVGDQPGARRRRLNHNAHATRALIESASNESA